MEYPKIDVRDICGALGVTYNSAFSVTYYLNMIYKLSLMQRAAEHSLRQTLGKARRIEEDTPGQFDPAYEDLFKPAQSG